MQPVEAHARYLKERYFQSLDALRFLAISLVVWQHTPRNPAAVPAEAWPIMQRGFLGIDVFFMLSGYLIVTLFLRERDKTGDVSLVQLFIRRALRLFPLYYALLGVFAAYFAFVRPAGHLAQAFFHNLPYYLTFTSNWVVLTGFLSTYWTLSTQEQFYLTWPVVEKYAPRIAIPLAVAMLAVSELVNFRVTAPIEEALGLRYEALAVLQVTLAPIFLGVLLAHLLHSEGGFRRAWPILGWTWTPLVALVVSLAVVGLPVASVSGLPRLVFQLGMVTMLGSAVARQDHALEMVMRWPPMLRVGQLCYGIFLFHMVTMWALERLATWAGIQAGWAIFLLNFALAWAAAEVSYRTFEMPFLRLKDRFRRRDPAATPAS